MRRPELVVRRINFPVQDGVRWAHPPVHDGQVLPIRAGCLHRLHFFVAPGGIGRLQIGTEDVFDPVIVPALRLDGGHDPGLEIRQRLPVLQGVFQAIAHQLDKVMMRQTGNIESPVLGAFPQRLRLGIRELGPPFPELDGRVRGYPLGDNLRGWQVKRLFLRHCRPPPLRRPRP